MRPIRPWFFKMPRFGILVGALLAGTASAQTASRHGLSDAQLETMSRQMPRRDWGPPVNPAPSSSPHFTTLSQHAICMSTASENEPIYAEPSLGTTQIGIAPGRIAVTDTRRNGWAEVYFNARKLGWIPQSHLAPFHAAFPGGATKCEVRGATPGGMIVYHVE